MPSGSLLETSIIFSGLSFFTLKSISDTLSITLTSSCFVSTSSFFSSLTGAVSSILSEPVFIDFEGSSVDSIARFYQGFGAENIPYYHIKQNRLPWWIRWKG